jgi:hypothetical protein
VRSKPTEAVAVAVVVAPATATFVRFGVGGLRVGVGESGFKTRNTINKIVK